jgi:hypothetical protein
VGPLLLHVQVALTRKHRTPTIASETFVNWTIVSVFGAPVRVPDVSTTTFGKINSAAGWSDATSARAEAVASTPQAATAADSTTLRKFSIFVLITFSPFLTACRWSTVDAITAARG